MQKKGTGKITQILQKPEKVQNVALKKQMWEQVFSGINTGSSPVPFQFITCYLLGKYMSYEHSLDVF